MEHHYPNVNAREWDSIHPHIEALLAAELTPENVRAWLQQWSDLESVLDEETDSGLAYDKNIC